MFDLFSLQHILLLLIVALVVVGPKDLPKLMHKLGQWAGKARGMANEFKKSFDDMARQSELDELRKEISDLKSHQSITDLETELNKPVEFDSEVAAATAAANLDTGPDPRSGELEITDRAPPPPHETAAP